MFDMACKGFDWWFQYYFGTTSPDTVDSNGISLLYHACRHGQYNVAKWLLEHGANINIQMKETPKSTSLQGAKYNGHLAIVELLLEYGADVTIKNDYKATVFEDGFSGKVDQDTASKINEILSQHRNNLKDQKIIDIHIYLDKDETDQPKTRLQLHHAAVYDDLLKALPNSLKTEHNHFSIARRPLIFDKKDTTIISAVCRARYANSKFIDTPLRLTLHQEPSNKNKSIRLDPKFDFRTFGRQFQVQGKTNSFTLAPSKDKQMINVGDLTLTFSESSIADNIKLEVKTLFKVDAETFGLPECICLFEISLYADTPKLRELPLVSITNERNARLYTLGTPSPYWFCCDTRRTRLPMLDVVHAFVRHVTIFPMILTLPADMVIANNFNTPLRSREKPVKCTCLDLQEHDPINFPEKAYHGTSIAVVRSILADGLVMPGTVVSAGKRVSPPQCHIPRGRKAFGVTDFADAIFLSPSVHYTCDPAYAVPFPYDDRQMLPVLECSVKKNSYQSFKSTVPTYCAHPDDNLETIEWRVSDPRNVVINAVLFIPMINSIEAAARERLAKITSAW
jgi:hypothetical protein